MPRHDPNSILLLGPGLADLKGFVRALNTNRFWKDLEVEGKWKRVRKDYRPVQRELRRRVRAWFESGPNVSKLLAADADLARAAGEIRARLVPTKMACGQLVYSTVPESTKRGWNPVAIALGLFLNFLLNPLNVRLGGPCVRCGKYYVKKTKRQKVYCSQRCGPLHTAFASNRKRRRLEHESKLRAARESISGFAHANTKMTWREWVSKNTGLSKTFLTRAVSSGNLQCPSGSCDS
jgi:hypothetical protein